VQGVSTTGPLYALQQRVLHGAASLNKVLPLTFLNLTTSETFLLQKLVTPSYGYACKQVPGGNPQQMHAPLECSLPSLHHTSVAVIDLCLDKLQGGAAMLPGHMPTEPYSNLHMHTRLTSSEAICSVSAM
jgi:hypothetical protein